MRHRFVLYAAAACAAVTMIAVTLPAQQAMTPKEELGKAIFFDTNLSFNANQSCASCHAPEAGWTGPHSSVNAHGAVYEGSISDRFGNRKPPSAAYATQSPIFHMDKKGLFVGGNFWDGRATGEKLGNPAADQAQGPFLNPKEQALFASADVVARVCASSYAGLFTSVWGASVCDPAYVDAAYDAIGLSVAAYEASSEVNALSSKFDYLKMGMATFTQQEERGRALFQGKAKCAGCHTSSGRQPLFTDYTFDNLGLPKNPENPVYDYDPAFIDPGLGGFLKASGYPEAVYNAEWGKHKVPTVRNVDLRPAPDFVKAYGHNGYFKTLEGIVHFYNTRDVKPTCPGDYTEAQALAANCWPAPEVAATVNTSELGDLGLSPADEAAIVAFLKTLSDGYKPPIVMK
jgi:cytochrome c peroxidase